VEQVIDPGTNNNDNHEDFGIKLELGTTRGPCTICLIQYPTKRDIINNESHVEQ